MKKIFFLILVLAAVKSESQDLLSRFDSLTRAYESNHFQGVVLVARGDSLLYKKAWGYADLDRKIPLTTGMIFKTESTGKMYTATAILQLVEAGKLRLTQTISDLLPDLPIKNADRITVHHLLSHTSGLMSPWDDPSYSFRKWYTRKDMETLIAGMPLVFESPGKEMFYSNSGYMILAWIVEKVSGQPFAQYLADHIFIPMGMKAVRQLDDTLMPAGQPQPYRFLNSKRYIPMNEMISPQASGAGGWLGRAEDLYQFMLGFDKNKYMKPKTLELMQTMGRSFSADSSFHNYNYGLEVFHNDPIKGTVYFGHSGGGAGFSIDAILEPASHSIVIFCSNTYVNSRSISSNYLRIALGLPAETVSQPNNIKVYDLIEEKGIDEFMSHEKEYFGSLRINPDERLFTSVADAMEMAGDFHAMALWTELGTAYFPANGFLHLMAGSSRLQTGDKEKAMLQFELAKSIGLKNNDPRMREEAERRIKQAK